MPTAGQEDQKWMSEHVHSFAYMFVIVCCFVVSVIFIDLHMRMWRIKILQYIRISSFKSLVYLFTHKLLLCIIINFCVVCAVNKICTPHTTRRKFLLLFPFDPIVIVILGCKSQSYASTGFVSVRKNSCNDDVRMHKEHKNVYLYSYVRSGPMDESEFSFFVCLLHRIHCRTICIVSLIVCSTMSKLQMWCSQHWNQQFWTP